MNVRYSEHGGNHVLTAPQAELDQLTRSLKVAAPSALFKLHDNLLKQACYQLAQQTEKTLEQKVIVKQQERLNELKEAVQLMKEEMLSWNLQFPDGLIQQIERLTEGEDANQNPKPI